MGKENKQTDQLTSLKRGVWCRVPFFFCSNAEAKKGLQFHTMYFSLFQGTEQTVAIAKYHPNMLENYTVHFVSYSGYRPK